MIQINGVFEVTHLNVCWEASRCPPTLVMLALWADVKTTCITCLTPADPERTADPDRTADPNWLIRETSVTLFFQLSLVVSGGRKIFKCNCSRRKSDWGIKQFSMLENVSYKYWVHGWTGTWQSTLYIADYMVLTPYLIFTVLLKTKIKYIYNIYIMYV